MVREGGPDESTVRIGTEDRRAGHVTLDGMRFDSDQSGVAAIETVNVDPNSSLSVIGCEFGVEFNVSYVAKRGSQSRKSVE